MEQRLENLSLEQKIEILELMLPKRGWAVHLCLVLLFWIQNNLDRAYNPPMSQDCKNLKLVFPEFIKYEPTGDEYEEGGSWWDDAAERKLVVKEVLDIYKKKLDESRR